jgi:hypothetical protein
MIDQILMVQTQIFLVTFCIGELDLIRPWTQKVVIGLKKSWFVKFFTYIYFFYDPWWFYLLKWESGEKINDDDKERTNVKLVGKK